MKKIIIFIFLSSIVLPQSNLTVSPRVDTLYEKLINNPEDYESVKKLIAEYNSKMYPELSYLEFLNMNSNQGVKFDYKNFGIILFYLSQYKSSYNNLVSAYLLNPNDEILKYLAILNYYKENKIVSNRLLKLITSRNADISNELYDIYQKLFLTGKKDLASSILNLLKDNDPKFYSNNISKPSIKFVSPASEIASEDKAIPVVVSIKCKSAIKSVTINNHLAFDNKDIALANVNLPFEQTFKDNISLKEGLNIVTVAVIDAFDNLAQESIKVSGLNFDRKAEWTSSLSDSIKIKYSLLRNYLDDTVIVTKKLDNDRLLTIGCGKDKASYDNSIFFTDLLLNNNAGFIKPENTKILVNERVVKQNISTVIEKWLLQQTNFQNKNIVYISGVWNVTSDAIYYCDYEMNKIDLKPYIAKLAQIGCKGVSVIFEGKIDNIELMEMNLKQTIVSTQIPVNFLIIPKMDWATNTLDRITDPSQTDTNGIYGTGKYLSESISGSVYISNKDDIPLFLIAGAKVAQIHAAMFNDLPAKFKVEKVNKKEQPKILDFLRNWKMYNELKRYHKNQMSIQDLMIRIDDYNERKSQVENENK